MPVHDLAQLTWEEVRDLDRSRTLVVLPVGAIEAHGPHLPLDSDVVIATAMARAGARRLAARGHVVLILPALAYTAARFGADFNGTLSDDEEILYAVYAGLFAEHGRPLGRDEYYSELAGLSEHEIVRAWLGDRENLDAIVRERIDRYRVARLLEPFSNGRFRHGLAEGGHADVSHVSPYLSFATPGREPVNLSYPSASSRNCLSCARCFDICPTAVDADAGRPA